jgi:protein-disulfide isomerase
MLKSPWRLGRFTFRRLARAAGVVALVIMPPCFTMAAEAPDPVLRGQIETVIQEYLKEHPELVRDALQELQRREREAQGKRAAAAIQSHAAELIRDPASPVGGNPKGDVTLVEFFDYQCGYCKQVEGEVAQLLRADPEIRLVYKELPILGPVSVVAAKAALAAHRQDKYAPLHGALMGTTDRLTEENIFTIAADAGLDVARLKQDMQDPAIAEALDRTRRLAEALGVRGTPAFVVGEELYPGAADLNTLQSLIARARK